MRRKCHRALPPFQDPRRNFSIILDNHARVLLRSFQWHSPLFLCRTHCSKTFCSYQYLSVFEFSSAALPAEEPDRFHSCSELFGMSIFSSGAPTGKSVLVEATVFTFSRVIASRRLPLEEDRRLERRTSDASAWYDEVSVHWNERYRKGS